MKFSTFSIGLLATCALLQPAVTAQITFVDDCDSTTIQEDRCCIASNGIDVCSNLPSVDGVFTVSKGSCTGGLYCCAYAGSSGGSAIIGENSCTPEPGFVDPTGESTTKDQSCTFAGNTEGDFKVGDGSCKGSVACYQAAQVKGKAVVGNGSCNAGFSACARIGYGTSTAIIGDGSCINWQACMEAGRGGSAEIGTNSCIGTNACYQVGCHEDGIVGDNSCVGFHACFGLGSASYQDIDRASRIGSNSCNCDNCCSCLGQDDKVNIPNNSCNELELSDGSNGPQCCTTDAARGTLPIADDITVTPTPPGGSGGDSGPTFNLQDYTVPAPVCAI
ncbi:unnamed protein product, partial [Cylindrotheca closterium]